VFFDTLTNFSSTKAFSTASSVNLSQYDPSQVKLLSEALILVDKEDKVLGQISKIDGHQNTYNRTGNPHRAFSVFLLNNDNQLMLHQRSKKKITFPSLWTNSCCSHPLYNDQEMVEENHLGAKKAIRRRVEFELGHDLQDINDLHFMGKIYYNFSESDPTWGEHEVDYIFFIKRDFKESDFKANPDEIEEIKWVGRNEIMKFLEEKYTQKNEHITPWFGAIMQYQLFNWWDIIIQGKSAEYKPSPKVADLNKYRDPIFQNVNGKIITNIQI